MLFPFPFALLGATILAISTRWGIGLTPDSVVYVGAARNLASGQGLTLSYHPGVLTPMTHYPPLFPTLLAGWGLLQMDPQVGARWLNDLLFAGNIAVIGLIVYIRTQSLWVSAFGSLFTMASFPIVQIHSMAWSEPLFIFFELLAISFLAIYMEKQGHIFLVASSVTAALGCLTRYAGIALIMTGVIALLFLNNVKWTKKLLETGLYFAIGSIPILLWTLRNFLFAGSATDRKFVFHRLTADHLESALDTISTWLLPPSVASATRITSMLAAVALMMVAFLMIRMGETKDQWRPTRNVPMLLPPLFVFVLSYVILLVVTILFYDAYTPLDNRILSPAYVAGLIVLICLFSDLLKSLRQLQAAQIAVMLLFLALFVSHGLPSNDWLRHSYLHGFGYASRVWRESNIVRLLADLDDDRPIFTNGADALYILTGRSSYTFPSKVDPSTHQININYLYELSSMAKQLRQERGILVYFNSVGWRWYIPSEDELKERLALRLLVREKDGSVYEIEHQGRTSNSDQGRPNPG